MIGHFLELWGMLLLAFVAGCVLGTLAYMAIAVSPWANAQIETADAIGNALAGRRIFRGRVETRSRSRPLAPQSSSTGRYPADYPGGDDRSTLERVPIESEALVTFDGTVREFGQSEWDHDADAAGSGYLGDKPPLPAATVLDDDLEPYPLDRTVPPAPATEPLPELPAMRPLTLPGPRNGVPDDLQRIRGIGQKNEELLNNLGIYHFGQIAAWTPAEARWVAGQLAFPDRIERDDWVGQAIILATGGDTGYVKVGNRRKGEETAVA